MQKIFVLYTGGTIGMKPSPDGLVPDAQLAEQALQPYAEQAVFHWHICQPLIDSSNITPQHWAEWLVILQAALFLLALVWNKLRQAFSQEKAAAAS